MNTLFKNRPVFGGDIIYSVILYLLTVASAVLMFTPVLVSYLNEFSTLETTGDYIYLAMRGLSAILMIIALNIAVIEKNIFFCCVPAITTAIMVTFPLAQAIRALADTVSFAKEFSMPADLSPYILTVVDYGLFFVISILTALYCTGILKLPVVIMALGVPAALASAFTVYTNLVSFEMELYDVLIFAYSISASLIPVVLTLSCDSKKEQKTKKYSAKRYA